MKQQRTQSRSVTKVNAFRWLLVVCLLLVTAVFLTNQPQPAQAQTFTGSELLGRPTDSSILVNVLVDQALEMYLEYGTVSGNLTQQTGTIFSTANVPAELEITSLQPNTRYYYRLLYRPLSGGSFVPRPEKTFHTQRASGEMYTFTIQADSHLGQPVLGDQTMYFQTLANQILDQPDFMIDLGDSVRVGPSESSIVTGYLLQRQALGQLGGVDVGPLRCHRWLSEREPDLDQVGRVARVVAPDHHEHVDVALGAMKDAIEKTYGKRGPLVVQKNVALVDGASDDARDLPLDVRGTAFQRRVWTALAAIPAGTTTTYAALAEIAALTAEVAELRRQVHLREEQIKEIFTNQGRLRENLGALGSAANERSLRDRYIAERAREEDRLAELRKAIKDLTAERETTENSVRERIAALTFDSLGR